MCTEAPGTSSAATDRRQSIHATDARPFDAQRHGAYVCLRIAPEARARLAAAPVPALADRLGLTNEAETHDGHPVLAIAFLKQCRTTDGQIADPALSAADAIVHVASPDAVRVDRFCTDLVHLLESPLVPRILRGVVRPTIYTGNATHNFAYAHQVLQQAGRRMPNATLIPTNKTPEWWAKDWMERHTYFLPHYANGQIRHEGHVMAAAAGIPCLMRRTYKNARQPAPDGEYDFLNYFECADADIPTLDAVMTRLRDVEKNPEWSFVREGPTWQGRRVAAWHELFA
jgi:hypothetical protein